MTWTPERVAELSKLWGTGASAAQIGRALGVTKNAVVGKVHRIGLPSRPVPTRRPEPEEERPVSPIRLMRADGPSCQWPFGDPQEEDFRFCGASALPGKPYCAEHHARAYTRGREEEASEAA